MKKKALFVLALVLFTVLTAGAVYYFVFPYEPKLPPKADDSGSTEEGIKKISESINEFNFKIFKQISEGEGNVFISPYSIYSAMAITYEGAEGDTEREFQKALGYPEKDYLRKNYAGLYNRINEKSRYYELKTGNALWAQEGHPILKSYIETVERHYGAKAVNLDFANETERARQTINEFISRQTAGKIKELFPRGILSPATKLVITNAVYFKGNWKYEFDPKLTQKAPFYVGKSREVEIDMMHLIPDKVEFSYYEDEKFKALELPYKGDSVSMLIALSKDEANSFDGFNADYFKKVLNSLRPKRFDDIYIPKFTLREKYMLKKTFMKLGLVDAFSDRADFSGIDGSRNLFIEEVIHEAFVKVDEKGTEAAGATGVVMREVSMGEVFKADRPFLFFIYEKSTETILFSGKLVEPR
jgi:serpin B